MTRRWDAGEMGCSTLIVELKARLAEVEPGGTLEVIARDPGAAVDLPAWCRMTGHFLVSEKHPVFVIRKKEE